MSFKKSHIIQFQSISIEFQNFDEAFGLQNHIAEVFYEKLQPKMEVLFDELFGDKYYASVDQLEIDCGLINDKNWEQEFTEQAIRKLKEQFQVNKKEINNQKAEGITTAETFLFFLENSYLPWNKRIDTIPGLEASLEISETLLSDLKKLIKEQPKAAERLASQFSKEFISKVIGAVTENRRTEFDEIKLLLEKLNPRFANTKAQHDEAITDKTKNVSKYTQPGDIPLAKSNKEKIETYKAGIYINNAGLILLHPFLQMFFEHLKLTEENRWLNASSINTAVLVLEYLVTGNENFEEFNLVLNKILFGIDTDEIIVTDQQLSDEIKNECEVLLSSVIKHWSVLKNTSNEGLRETFLQRNGKLSKVDNGWLLQVEQKAVDILLGHLPWGIGIIKLPWMEEILHVEWT